jgi:hypothetical protein
MINNDLNNISALSGVVPSGTQTTTITTNRIVQTATLFTGLIKRQTYNYYIEGKGGNHPAIVLPNSGTFTAQTKEKILNFDVVFCKNELECPVDTTGLLPYTDTISNDPIYNSFVVRLEADGDITYGDFISVKCNNCIDVEDQAQAIEITPSDNFAILGINDCEHGFFDIANLKPQTTYYYSIEANDSSWPTTVMPPTGAFTVYNNQTYKLPFSLCSCGGTGLCPSDTPGLLPYSSSSMDYFNQIYKTNGNNSYNMLRGTSWNLRLKENTSDNTDTVAMASVYTGYSRRSATTIPSFRNFVINTARQSDGLIAIDFDIVNLDPYTDYVLDFSKTNATWYVRSDDLTQLSIPGDNVMVEYGSMDVSQITQSNLHVAMSGVSNSGVSNSGVSNNIPTQPSALDSTGVYRGSVELEFLNINNASNANINTRNIDSNDIFTNLSMRLSINDGNTVMPIFERNLVVDGVDGPHIDINTEFDAAGIYHHTLKTSVTDLKYSISVSESNWPIIIENATGLLHYGDSANGLFDVTIEDNLSFCVSYSRCVDSDGYVASTETYNLGEEKYVKYNLTLLDLDDNIFFRSMDRTITAPANTTGPSANVSSNINN